MKTIIVAAVVGVAAQAVALAPGRLSVSASIQAKLQAANPFARTPTPDKFKIERYGGISSRPWTQTVGWHPGEPSAFMDLKTHDEGWHLLWFGAEPKR